MKDLLLFLFVFSTLGATSQELDCADFKEGKFISKIETPDGMKLEIQITREGSKQIEETIKASQELIDQGFPMEAKESIVEWIDSCHYRILSDESDPDLDAKSKYLNSQGGIQVKITAIDGDCYTYKSFVDGIDLVVEGQLCKLE